MESKILYAIITDIWKLTKKYTETIEQNQNDNYWDGLRDEATAIYNATAIYPEYVREFASDMIMASINLLEKVYREEKDK